MTAAVILAAGQGTRMRSHRVKVLHELGGRPLLEHVLTTVQALDLASVVVVVGAQHQAVEALVNHRALTVRQPDILGTGDAVRRAVDVLPNTVERVLVLYGDGPLVPLALLRTVVERGQQSPNPVIVTARMPDPTGYGRIVRNDNGQLVQIVEEKDATADQAAITEINTGIGIWPLGMLEQVLPRLIPHGQEVYLTDAVGAWVMAGGTVGTLVAPDPERVMGINTREELARAEAILRRDTVWRLMNEGVTIIDPQTTYVESSVRVGMDTVIYPMTTLRGRTVIGDYGRIGPGTTIVDGQIGDHAVIEHSVVELSHVGPKCHVGPFSHLRAGTYLERDVHIGNFVEVKNSRIGLGSKAGHHCYLGDATIGSHVNIGAGTVIVNYDGVQKHPTFIGDDAFIGCNANLVAPVEIGSGAYVAAGSTVTHNVPADALGIARARQENKVDWVTVRRASKERS